MGYNQPERRPLSQIRWDRVLQHKLPWNSESLSLAIRLYHALEIFLNFKNIGAGVSNSIQVIFYYTLNRALQTKKKRNKDEA